ncbi:DNA-binding response regulator [Streptomyces carminius]|uniref:DNA-binding response regulator n=1 Tax=Streptomyces carminius TaxID=2665496 RepID=A0A2M8LWL2_9ACTN|nr:response regulator transcription factor [Streptomyces carminius]PJE96356.1 DNA-binding response regulator [Streptomyces carminius]
MNMRVLLCCDESIMSAGIRALLNEQPDVQVVGHSSGRDCARITARSRPDIVLVISPALSIEHRRELAQLAAMAKVVLIPKAENTHRSLEAVRQGVSAVLAPDTSADELIHTLRTISSGEAMVIPKATRRALFSLPGSRDSDTASRLLGTLTPREAEVLLLLARGSSNTEIAGKLSVSEATVRSHVHHLLRKLNVESRTQAVALAYESGIMAAMEERAEGKSDPPAEFRFPGEKRAGERKGRRQGKSPGQAR